MTLAGWQDRSSARRGDFGVGCRCNRATVELIEAAGAAVPQRSDAKWRAMPAIVRPLVSGAPVA